MLAHSRIVSVGWALAAVAMCSTPRRSSAEHLGEVAKFGVIELTLRGPDVGSADAPARDVELAMTFRHESGALDVRVHGFWDGDGRGGRRGNVFKVRFCPARPGRWEVVDTASNRAELNGQRHGDTLACTESQHPGLWIADGRWYRRSDGSHPFIVGNTHYSFLSRRNDRGAVASDPVDDVRRNREHFSKLRFALTADRYPDPDLKPFLDDSGAQTDDGRFSHRPNPQWFHHRVDPVIAEGHRADLICDIILCGPDTRESRSTLRGNPRPWLRYAAARYASYPNVWFCLANEWDIKEPKYTPAEMKAAGAALRSFLPHATPISVHGAPARWNPALSGAWHDHVIIQHKLKKLGEAADSAARNFEAGGGKPVVNDENAYQGAGDKFSEADTVEGCFGTFLGGAYASTGEKYGNKLGQYFWGGFDAEAHSAAPRLGYLRDYVDRSVRFWAMRPLEAGQTPFAAIDGVRVLGTPGEEYVVGTSRAVREARVELPPGKWRVTQVDLMKRQTRALAEDSAGRFRFTAPDSRAVMTHFRSDGAGEGEPPGEPR
jgi:hypothetical protein